MPDKEPNELPHYDRLFADYREGQPERPPADDNEVVSKPFRETFPKTSHIWEGPVTSDFPEIDHEKSNVREVEGE